MKYFRQHLTNFGAGGTNSFGGDAKIVLVIADIPSVGICKNHLVVTHVEFRAHWARWLGSRIFVNRKENGIYTRND